MSQLSRNNLPLRLPVFLLLAGCGTQAAPLHPLEQAKSEVPALGARIDEMAAGSIRGRVVWTGDLPPERAFRDAKLAVGESIEKNEKKNPGLPHVKPPDNGAAGAVVFLRKVEPERSKPWDHPSAGVVMKDGFIRVEQSGGEHSSGFVHVGDSIEMISRSSTLEMLRAQGAAFFTLPFPEPEKPIRRALAQKGIVELSSAAGSYWARSWLFVAEHPYYTRTDEEGRFILTGVPEGSYELVCWMPNWNVDHFDRDPEVLNVSRVYYMPPVERTIAVKVERGTSVNVVFQPEISDFPVNPTR